MWAWVKLFDSYDNIYNLKVHSIKTWKGSSQINLVPWVSHRARESGKMRALGTRLTTEMVFFTNTTILRLSAQWPRLWMAARLEVTFFWYRPHCCCWLNQVVWMLTKRQRGLYQSKVTSSLTCIQRPGNWACNCKTAYWPKYDNKID